MSLNLVVASIVLVRSLLLGIPPNTYTHKHKVSMNRQARQLFAVHVSIFLSLFPNCPCPNQPDSPPFPLSLIIAAINFILVKEMKENGECSGEVEALVCQMQPHCLHILVCFIFSFLYLFSYL